jgi:hypothetical protein
MKEYSKMAAQTLPRGRMPEGEGLCRHFGVFRHEGDPTQRAPLLGFPTPWEVVWFGRVGVGSSGRYFFNNRYITL